MRDEITKAQAHPSMGRARYAANGGRALPVWFRFELLQEFIDHSLDDTLHRKWEVMTNGVGIPATYSQLDAGGFSPRPAATRLLSDCFVSRLG